MDISLNAKTSGWEYLSKGISYLLHPFLMPVYMMFLLFATGLVPVYVADGMRKYLLSVVIINTVFIPTIAIILMRIFGIIPDYSLSTRHDRILPLLIVALCYGLCGWILNDIPAVFLLRRCLFAAMGCTVFAFGVNLRWQVSLHMTAIGGAVGIVGILLLGGFFSLIWLLCAMIVAAGLLASARLYLGKHTPAQIAVGFFGGFIVSVLILLFTA